MYVRMLDLQQQPEGTGGVTPIDRLLEAVQQRGMHPSGRALSGLAVAYTRAELWHKAMALFDTVVSVSSCAMHATMQVLRALFIHTGRAYGAWRFRLALLYSQG